MVTTVPFLLGLSLFSQSRNDLRGRTPLGARKRFSLTSKNQRVLFRFSHYRGIVSTEILERRNASLSVDEPHFVVPSAFLWFGLYSMHLHCTYPHSYTSAESFAVKQFIIQTRKCLNEPVTTISMPGRPLVK